MATTPKHTETTLPGPGPQPHEKPAEDNQPVTDAIKAEQEAGKRGVEEAKARLEREQEAGRKGVEQYAKMEAARQPGVHRALPEAHTDPRQRPAANPLHTGR